MIARLHGRLVGVLSDSVIVDVHGVGYQVFIPVSTLGELPAQGGEVTLLTHTHVREDALQLFGFRSDMELQLFTTLISVSGIGPRLGLTILSSFQPEEFQRAIAQGDVAQLTRIPGVGKKTAQRMVLELKDKLKGTFTLTDDPSSMMGAGNVSEDAMAALVSLGYSRAEAERAVGKAASTDHSDDLAGLIKAALKIVGPEGGR